MHKLLFNELFSVLNNKKKNKKKHCLIYYMYILQLYFSAFSYIVRTVSSVSLTYS